MLAAFALANLKHDIGALLKWLTHASFWQIVSIGLGGFCLILLFQRADARSDAARYMKQRDFYHAELTRITTARNEQKAASEANVAKVVQGQREARTIVRTIEAAPNPENCATPALPLLRNAL